MKKDNLQILLLAGPAGAGKSTFAKQFLATAENWMHVSRDDIRNMQFNDSKMSVRQENLITAMIYNSVSALLSKKSNVLIDATNCKPELIQEFINRYNHLADITFKLFDIDKETLAEQCNKKFEETGKRILPRAQTKSLAELENLKENFDFSIRPKIEEKYEIREQDSNLPKAIICDLDGTLALMNGRDPLDASTSDNDLLNEPVANLLKNYTQLGYKILLITGREDKFKTQTLKFLEQHAIHFDQLWMRRSFDFRKDAMIKTEIFNREIVDKYFIEFVLDDRNQVVDLWRKDIKLPCFQVNYGDF